MDSQSTDDERDRDFAEAEYDRQIDLAEERADEEAAREESFVFDEVDTREYWLQQREDDGRFASHIDNTPPHDCSWNGETCHWNGVGEPIDIPRPIWNT